MQVSQKGKRGHSEGVEEGGAQLEQEDLMGLTITQHVSPRVSVSLFLCLIWRWPTLYTGIPAKDPILFHCSQHLWLVARLPCIVHAYWSLPFYSIQSA